MANIGIMGGTFDPPHLAHLMIAESAYSEFSLDKVLFMPSGNPPHKSGRAVTDKKIREKMTLSSISGNPHFELCSFEIEKEEYSYTAKTIKFLKEKYPDDNFFLIIGEDSLAYLDKWYKPEIITSLATLLVYKRGGNFRIDKEVNRIKNLLNAEIKIINAPLIDISSTEIRKRISEGKSVRYQVLDSVIEIIKTEKLYLQENFDD